MTHQLHRSTMVVSNPSLSLILVVLLVGLASNGYRVSAYAASSSRTPIQEVDFNALAYGYMNNSELENAIKEFNDRCGHISKIYSIGESVNGVKLQVIEISNNPGVEEAKPAFKFIGNMHGDEPVGRELLFNLAEWLCENYLTDDLATFIVDNVHLHILPSMNPDGFSLRKRENAKGKDLNRDFRDQFKDWNNDPKKRQPETRAVMRWSEERRFTASASIHGGGLFASFPWDGTQNGKDWYHACPDDDVFKHMARLYSRSNPSMRRERYEGIINGALCYNINGGMQDWNYIHADCFELTLELSKDKWPPAQELLMIWQDNKRSMLNLVASVARLGVNGKIFSSDGSGPLPASISVKRKDYTSEVAERISSSDVREPLPASMSINGITYTSELPGRISKSDSEEPLPEPELVTGEDKTIKASKTFGYYHRLLVPGHEYEVTATLRGYETQIRTITTSTQEPVNLPFYLDPDTSQDKKDFYQKLESFQLHLAPVVFTIFVGASSKLREWIK